MSKKFVPHYYHNNNNNKFYKSQLFQDYGNNETNMYKIITQQKINKFENIHSNVYNSIQNEDTIINQIQNFRKSNISQKPQSTSSAKQNSPSQFRNVFQDSEPKTNNKSKQITKKFIENNLRLDQLQRQSFPGKKVQQVTNLQDTKQKTSTSKKMPKHNYSQQKVDKQSFQQNLQEKEFSISQFQQLRDQQINPQQNQILQCQKKLIEIQQKFLKQRQSLYKQKFVLQRQNAIKDGKIDMLERLISQKGLKQQEYNNFITKPKDINKQFIQRQNTENIESYPKRQLIKQFEKVIKDKQAKINQLLHIIQKMNDKIQEKSIIINELTYDKMKLQTIIQNMVNKIFILQNKQANNMFYQNQNIGQNIIAENNQFKQRFSSPKIDLNQVKSYTTMKKQEKYHRHQDSADKRAQILKTNKAQNQEKQRYKQKQKNIKALNNTFHSNMPRTFFKIFKSPTNKVNGQSFQNRTEKIQNQEFINRTKKKNQTYAC